MLPLESEFFLPSSLHSQQAHHMKQKLANLKRTAEVQGRTLYGLPFPPNMPWSKEYQVCCGRWSGNLCCHWWCHLHEPPSNSARPKKLGSLVSWSALDTGRTVWISDCIVDGPESGTHIFICEGSGLSTECGYKGCSGRLLVVPKHV